VESKEQEICGKQWSIAMLSQTADAHIKGARHSSSFIVVAVSRERDGLQLSDRAFGGGTSVWSAAY
jgi:hypothetical protein